MPSPPGWAKSISRPCASPKTWTCSSAARISTQPGRLSNRRASAIAIRQAPICLDGPDARARDAVRVIFAGERVRPEYVLPAPDVSESEESEAFKVLRLDALVRMKLASFRDKDRTHL